MPRLIDADALMESIGCADAVKYGNRDRAQQDTSYSTMMLYEIRDEIDAQPTIGGWISVKKKLPEEHESIFHKFLGTPMWSSAMWEQESDKVLVCVSFPDGTSVVATGRLHNSAWVTTVSRTLPQTVTHWMPLPEPPEEAFQDD